jgi:hypothetical protein
VPRHLFVPEASVEDAYADSAVVTKRAVDGAALSCASVPTVVAMMLDQLDRGRHEGREEQAQVAGRGCSRHDQVAALVALVAMINASSRFGVPEQPGRLLRARHARHHDELTGDELTGRPTPTRYPSGPRSASRSGAGKRSPGPVS